MMNAVSRMVLILAMTAFGIGLSACREDEQGRPLTEQKGVYEGKADQKLSDERLDELRLRAAGQKF